MDMVLGLLAGVLVLGGLGTLGVAWWLQRRSGLPRARLVYSDTGAWQRADKPLFSRTYGLAGKPDYLLETHGQVIPVEVKPSRQATQPQPADVLQLLAYCLLVEETWGRPAYGLLHYASGTFRLDSPAPARPLLRAETAAVRAARQARDMPRSHDQPGRCAACAFRLQCDESLV
jgi:CRISPR-associated exonuclease Cas4